MTQAPQPVPKDETYTTTYNEAMGKQLTHLNIKKRVLRFKCCFINYKHQNKT